MAQNNYKKNDVCVVGIGCVLPNANSPEQFWENLSEATCSIRKIPDLNDTANGQEIDSRSAVNFFCDPHRAEEDRIMSNMAGFVSVDTIRQLGQINGINFDESSRLEIMAVEATRQALKNVKILDEDKVGVFLGLMNQDEKYYQTRDKEYIFPLIMEKLKKYNCFDHDKIEEEIITSIDDMTRKFHQGGRKKVKDLKSQIFMASALDKIKKKFDLAKDTQVGYLDAACAASIEAIDISVKKLSSYQIDTAITGGVESNLGLGTFLIFSKVQAISPEPCLPYDKKSKGLSQSEGSVVLILKRLEDAKRQNLPIYGIIRSIGASSDGRSAGLFQPTVEGQMLAYNRAYSGLENCRVDYLEGHGTGTTIGDSVELKSLSTFFKGYKIPVGSVKSLVGHTKATAGSASLLKCLLSMKHRIIPPSKYFRNLTREIGSDLYVNRGPLKLKKRDVPLRMGISSFGFGGTNYHLVLDEYNKDFDLISKYEKKDDSIVVIAKSYIPKEMFDPKRTKELYRVPPKSLSQIDKFQLLAITAVKTALENSNIKIDDLDTKNVSVFSAGCTGLGKNNELSERLAFVALVDSLERRPIKNQKLIDMITKLKNEYPIVTEDTGPGILNNVIAGRVCNAFDFQGKNFSVDAEMASLGFALDIAKTELEFNPSPIVIIALDEKFCDEDYSIHRSGVNCIILTTRSYALEKHLPIKSKLKNITYHDRAIDGLIS